MHLSSILASALALNFASAATLREKQILARSESASNPIAEQYSNDVTGTLNSTIAVVPISYTLARSIIPARYGILKNAYQSLLPGFPKDKYPVSS